MQVYASTLSVRRPLARWLSLSFGVFVVVASLGLVVVFQQIGLRQEEESFAGLARSNADFLRRSTLPRSPDMEARLGAVMDARVAFLAATAPPLKGVPADGEVRRVGGDEMLVGHDLGDGMRVYFSRPSAGPLALVNHRRTWLAMGVLWLSSLGLGTWLARGLTSPLRQMVDASPALGSEGRLPDLPVERPDEIGLLARSMQSTHEALIDEREKRRAAERLALLGRMAASLAHEVRNPVAAIRLHAQLLEGAPPEEAGASRTLIGSEAERIETLLNQWMHFARPEPPVLMRADAVGLVEKALAILKPKADHARVKITADHAGPVRVKADAERILQVLVNVITNAVQAQQAGGSVKLGVTRSGPRCVIQVDDTGGGFSTEALQKAKEPFFSEKEGGMGLGLAVGEEILRAHGGELRLENTATGARVSLILPADESAPA